MSGGGGCRELVLVKEAEGLFFRLLCPYLSMSLLWASVFPPWGGQFNSNL